MNHLLNGFTGKDSIEDVLTPFFGGPVRFSMWSDQDKEEFERAKAMPFFKEENYKKPNFSSDLWNQVWQDHLTHDGVFDVSDLPCCEINSAEHLGDAISDAGLEFVKQHGPENIYIANGYQVPVIFLFAGKPKEIAEDDIMGHFGRGACAIFDKCPKRVLIVAEND